MDRSEIVQAIEAEICSLTNKPSPGVDGEIFSSGYLDSLNILHIIMFLEQKFSIKIDPFGVNLTTFGTINKIADFVEDNLS